MVTISKKIDMTLALLFLFLIQSCSIIQNPIKIAVVENYVGWCYIIPVYSTENFPINIKNEKYHADLNGVVYVPAQVFQINEDYIIEVYESRVNITDAMRYAGTVHRVQPNKQKYDYASFYLPSHPERAISDGEQYWRDRSHEYSQPNIKKIDSLLQHGVIFWK